MMINSLWVLITGQCQVKKTAQFNNDFVELFVFHVLLHCQFVIAVFCAMYVQQRLCEASQGIEGYCLEYI